MIDIKASPRRTTESKRLTDKYKKVTVVPLYYTLDDNKLSLIEE